MTKPILYIAAPASPGTTVLAALGIPSAEAFLDKIQEVVGDAFVVRGKPALIDGEYDDKHGGRRDDAARVRELNRVMADDRVAGLVAARGGGWMTRILPDLDFSLLDRRKTTFTVFGFSEITPMVNLVGLRRKGLGCYYMTPGFPVSGMSRWGRLNIDKIAPGKRLTGKRAYDFAERWAKGKRDEQFAQYFRDVTAILTGKAPQRALTGKLVAGRLPKTSTATFIGGCMSLVTPLTVAAYQKVISPRGKWIVLEDLEEYPYRIDRQIAHLKLAGWFEQCAGVMIGDFHMGDDDQQAETLEILKFHLPKGRKLPIITTSEVGHTWPQAVLPIGKPARLRTDERARGRSDIAIDVDWSGYRAD
ncbi:MAG: LD-carboxypeptidase [Phycisphaerales bacterium]|nr:LD-carboxypeptidase [Phycisphaerales bacterium]